MTLRVGDIVKYVPARRNATSVSFFREVNGDRVLLELICDYRIKPLETVAINEVCAADD